jgi:hypothetical protein
VDRWIAAGEQKQWAIDQLFPGAARSRVPMTVEVVLSAPGVAYASLVDNASTDAVTYLGTEPAHDWVVPAIAHNPGKEGTFWRSDVAMTNLSYGGASVILEYLPENQDNGSGGVISSNVYLGAQSAIVIEDVAGQVFDVEDGKGVLLIRSSRELAVASRVFTDGPGGGTTGHGVHSVPLDSLSSRPRVLPGVRMMDGFRTNVGVVTGDVWASVRFRLRDEDGSEKAERWVSVPARTLKQWSVDRLFGKELQTPDPVGSLVVDSDADFLVYLVVIDGSSQDPVFFMPAE